MACSGVDPLSPCQMEVASSQGPQGQHWVGRTPPPPAKTRLRAPPPMTEASEDSCNHALELADR